MTDMPKIVEKRLKAAGPFGDHPDPDVLTAFAEQSLRARERAKVLEHVSRCRDCRQVLALAAPPMEAVPAESTVRGSSRNWLRWPALRWGAAAACFVVVGAAVLLERNYKADRYASLTPPAIQVSKEKQIAEHQVAENKDAAISDLTMQKSMTPGVAQPSSALNAPAKDHKTDAVRHIAPPAVSADSPKPSMNTMLIGGLATSARQHASAEANERAMSSNLERDRRSDQSLQEQSLQLQAASPAPVPPSATPASPPEGPAVSGGAIGGLMAKKQVPGRAKPSPAPAQLMGRSADAVEVTGVPVAVNGRNMVSLEARWTISDDGQLQRSLDSGNTWEVVPVVENSSLDLVSAEATPNYQKAMRAPLSEKAKARTEPSPKPNPPKFRALSANGNDVWVGGSAGLLYHSADAGMHWTRVPAVADGVTLTADIVTLDFADAQHGKVTTSAGESWATTDGGRTWKKQ